MANVSAVPALPAIPSQIGRYKIVCELGQGGMGTIYLGRAEGIGGFERLMAIKMIHPHLSKQQSFINMFLDEARIAALIRHPNVVPVYEIGEHFGRHFIAMDYVSGEPLSILLDNTWCRGIPLDFDVVAYIVSVVCEALHAAHDLTDPTGRPLKVVHRDVCPQNIMLGYDGITRVMDFGVAKAVDQLSQTRPGTHKGKVPYMAPEQIRCQPIDRRSDIFSLGVVLWESTIGKRLFKAENDILSASKVLKGKVPRPSHARESYPLELEAIVIKALNPRPERRYQTAREMGQALREYLAHRASLVSPSDIESLLKEICKNRYERRTEMERRAATAGPFDSGVIEETIQLFASGDSNLPSFDVEAVLEPLVKPKDALLSSATARPIYEFEDEELDDATVRTQLEEIGFLATAEFDLLDDDDRDAPQTVIERHSLDDFVTTRKLDTSGVRSSHDVINQLLQEELADDSGSRKTPIQLPAQYSLGGGDMGKARELTPVVKLDLVGGKRGLMVIGGSLFAVALVAIGLGAALDDDPAPAVAKAPAEEVAPAPPPPVVRPIEVPVQALELEKRLPKIEAPPPKPQPPPVKAMEEKNEAVTEPVKAVEEPPPPAPVEKVVEKPEPAKEEPEAPAIAELDEEDKEQIARRSKKKKRDRRERSKSERKKTATKEEDRFLVEPDDL